MTSLLKGSQIGEASAGLKNEDLIGLGLSD